MQRLDLVGTVTGTRFAAPSSQIEIVLAGTATAPRWQVINHVSQETVGLAVVEGAVGSQTGLSVHGSNRVALTVDGVAGSVLNEVIAAAKALDGNASVTSFLSGTQAVQGQMVEMLGVTIGTTSYVYSARPAGSGIAIHEIGPAGALTARGIMADTATTFAATVTAMVAVQVGTTRVLYAGSNSESGVQAYAIGANGGLVALDAQGPAQGVPMQGVTALRSVALGGESYVIAAAAGSSSLTVFRVGVDGKLACVDHLIDDLGTRFAGATVLDAVEVDGRVFVVAGGADEGLSLFTMAPGGRLVHLQALPDTAAMGLANVSALEMVRVGSEVQVMVASGAEAGLTLLRMDLANLGDVIAASAPIHVGSAANDLMFRQSGQGVLEGGSGDDILIDGAGLDELRGGAGDDLFVLTADGKRDLIQDFQPSNDRIDLSLWPFLRNTGQLQVTSTATGAIIAFGDEVLEIRTASGTTLTVAQVMALSVLPVSRMLLGGGGGQPAGQLIRGTNATDTLTGGAGDDTIEGLGGNDLLFGGAGADQHFGGTGNDTVSYAQDIAAVQINLTLPATNNGAAAGDTFSDIEGIVGTALDDRIIGDAVANTFFGAQGADWLEGLAGDDMLWGEGGDDSVKGGIGNDTLHGGDGNDNLPGEAGDDIIYGDADDDELGGGDGGDRLYGGAGQDVIGGGSGADRIYGDDGDDMTSGGYGSDQVYGGAGNDTLAGSYGNDQVDGDAGNDSLGGGTGQDTVHGGAGADTIGAGDDDDQLFGEADADFLAGGPGNDQLYGGDGIDRLNGGAGNDSLWGGTGADVFVFNAYVTGEQDRVEAFEDGIDKLQMLFVAGTGAAAKFASLEIGSVVVDGTAYVQIGHAGHSVLVSGVRAAQIDASDFLWF